MFSPLVILDYLTFVWFDHHTWATSAWLSHSWSRDSLLTVTFLGRSLSQSSKDILFSVGPSPFGCPSCLEYLRLRALILLKILALYKPFTYFLTYLLTYLHFLSYATLQQDAPGVKIVHLSYLSTSKKLQDELVTELSFKSYSAKSQLEQKNAAFICHQLVVTFTDLFWRRTSGRYFNFFRYTVYFQW